MNNLKTNTDRLDTIYGTRFNGIYSITGIVHVIRNTEELEYFREGEILVAERIDPSWVDQLTLAKALIEDAATSESAAVDIAARYDIPATINVPDALLNLRSGDIVTMYSDGEIERVKEKRAPDSPMRVSVPAAVKARDFDSNITANNVVAFANVKTDCSEKSEDEYPDADKENDQNDRNLNSGS